MLKPSKNNLPHYQEAFMNTEFTPEQIYTLDTNGIVVVKGFLQSHIVDYINKVIDAHLVGKQPTPSKFAFFTLDPIFIEIMSNSWIMNACKKTVGDQFRFDHVVGIEQPGYIKSAKTGNWVEQGYNFGNIHGGLHSSQGNCFYHSFSDKIHAGHMTFGISLTGQSDKTGGFCYIPGSHKQSNSKNGANIFQEILKQNYSSECIFVPNLLPGDGVFFSESLMHGTTPLKPPNKRRAIYYKYLPGFSIWRSYDEIKHYMSLATTDLQRKLLRPPYVGNIDDSDGTMSDNKYKEETI